MRPRALRASAWLPAIALLFAVGCGRKVDVWEQEVEHGFVGLDPFAFSTAAEQYAVAARLPMDEKAAGWIAAVATRLDEGDCFEDDPVWRALLELEPYRSTEEVQAAVPTWVATCVERLPLAQVPTIEHWQDQADDLYRRGRFWEASAIYWAALSEHPRQPDTRNNLALSEMHQNRDLRAQVQLEVLRSVSPDYAPAMINLTVVYERLGLRERAEGLARELYEADAASEAFPPAIYNMAWFDSLDGGSQEVAEYLRGPAEIGVDPAYAALYNVNARQLENEPLGPVEKRVEVHPADHYLYRGASKVVWDRESWGQWAIAMVFFVIGSGVLWKVTAYWDHNHGEELPAGCVGLLIPAVGWLIFWGLPIGWGWLLLPLYVAVVWLSAMVSK